MSGDESEYETDSGEESEVDEVTGERRKKKKRKSMLLLLIIKVVLYI